MQVFQTWDESSILSTRTKKSKNNHLWLFLVLLGWGPGSAVSLYPHQNWTHGSNNKLMHDGDNHKGLDLFFYVL